MGCSEQREKTMGTRTDAPALFDDKFRQRNWWIRETWLRFFQGREWNIRQVKPAWSRHLVE